MEGLCSTCWLQLEKKGHDILAATAGGSAALAYAIVTNFMENPGKTTTVAGALGLASYAIKKHFDTHADIEKHKADLLAQPPQAQPPQAQPQIKAPPPPPPAKQPGARNVPSSQEILRRARLLLAEQQEGEDP